MTARTPVDDPAPRGRPRSADRTAAILDATEQVIDEIGFDRLRVQDVASRAGVGLATIYRRWATREELIAATMLRRPLAVFEPSDDPLESLHRLLVSLAQRAAAKVANFPMVMAAAREHEVLRHAVRQTFEIQLRGHLRAAIGDVLGADHPQVGTLVDAVPGLLVVRASAFGEPLDPRAYADEVVALVTAVSDGGPR